MDLIKEHIFQRFDIISIIMPYYAPTHKAFLLLSTLWTESRRKVDEFYEEFVKYMRRYWICLPANENNLKQWLCLPHDLFILNIWPINEKIVDTLIYYILDTNELKGWYFNNHFMQSKLALRNHIWVNEICIKKLYPHLKILSSIQVLLVSSHFKDWANVIQTISLYTKKKKL